ncbi:alpha/beta hydrolase [Gottfriedia acidiceleris]|uniref:alpha/beta fold hydrolase n=1 Tax=Gottfriedia acidiceleris TaxID=371036 RepID=UPI002FFEF203
MKLAFTKVLLSMIFVIGVLLIIGTLYQWIGINMDTKNYKPVGQIVKIHGNKMHLYTEGKGDTTVVFASGWGTVQPYVDYYPLFSKLSIDTKIAVYDRFGYGFSDLTNRERDIDSIVEEVHELLKKSNQNPPYIFVGHSLGSLETIRFAQKYPDEVKGIVLLDGGTPEYYEKAPLLTSISYIQRFIVKTGIVRILTKSNRFMDELYNERNGLKFIPEPLRELDRKATVMIANNRNITDEMRQSRNNAKKVINGPKPLNIPIIALTAGSFGSADKNWLSSQQEWKNWSTDVTQIVVEDANHYIHQYQPELVVEKIKKLIGK